jgi:hypothetical protein
MKKQKKQQINLLKTLKKLEGTNKKDPKNKKNVNPFIILFIIAILLSGVYTFLVSPTKEVINTDVGLNDIQTRYAS